MSSKTIYTSQDRTPYTYFIRWNDLDLNYYGRRTAKKCQPEEFFITYFTSSKLVADIIAEYGMPDVIAIHRIFSDIESCKLQEEKYLKRVDAKHSLCWLNQTNASMNWDSTNKVAVRDNNGNNYLIDKNDSRYLSGELIPVGKNKKTWNAGLTKESDQRIAIAAEKHSLVTKGIKRGPYSNERKNNISIALKGKYKWYTNGELEIHIHIDELPPENYINGRLPRNRNKKVVCRIIDKKEMDIGNYTKWLNKLISKPSTK